MARRSLQIPSEKVDLMVLPSQRRLGVGRTDRSGLRCCDHCRLDSCGRLFRWIQLFFVPTVNQPPSRCHRDQASFAVAVQAQC